MKHGTTASTFRTATPVVTATLLLLVAVALRVLPPNGASASGASGSASVPGGASISGGAGVAGDPGAAAGADSPRAPGSPDASGNAEGAGSAQWDDLPYRTHIVTDYIQTGGDGRHRSVTWHLPAAKVAPLLYQLELTAAATRYDARETASGWAVAAAFDNTAGQSEPETDDRSDDASLRPTEVAQEPTLSRQEWTAALNAAISVLPAPPPLAETDHPQPVRPVATPAAASTPKMGGSGYVRIESRGRMNWLWDAEVLRLEPAR